MRPTIEAPPVLQALYGAALRNLLDTNVTADGFIRAGGGYAEPWTRDAAINCWHAASLLAPDIARATLLKVCETRPDGSQVIAQDNQWWDQIIWVIGAWQHFLVTGDTAFAAAAYRIGCDSLEILDREHHDAATGLYEGPSLMQDGISGFPEPPYEAGNRSSFVLDHPGAAELRCLSTNAIYVQALRCLAQLGDQPVFSERADALAEAINRHLWDDASGLYGYFLGPSGLDRHQETAGLALAVEFGIAGPERTTRILGRVHREPYGLVNVWPHFDRYDEAHPGRHNAICWPMVMGLWGAAAASVGDVAVFGQTLDDLIRLFHGSDDDLFELYNATTGAVDGGWQVDRPWESLPDQTWSATALLRLIHEGLFGLHFTPTGIAIRPTVPPGYENLRLTGLRYRQATLDLTLSGTGTRAAVSLDGHPVDPTTAVPATLTGHHTLDIHVTEG